MFGQLVYYAKIDPLYFWDEMTFDEANVLFDVINQDNQFKWEMERMNWFYLGMWDRNKVKKPIDLMKFTWEKEEQEQEKEDIETTKQRLLELMNSIN